MKVKLTYFKPSGKYYSEGEYETSLFQLWMIWNEVEVMLEQGTLPGLVQGAREFMVLVDVPEHEHRCPQVIYKPEFFDAGSHPSCEMSGCTSLADYEGWYRVLDFAGMQTGLIQRRVVCERHKNMLIGGQKDDNKKQVQQDG